MLSGLLAVAQPVVSLFYKVDKFVHQFCGLQEPHNGGVSTLTEEIRTVVDEGQREGVLESEARTMIHRVMELQEEDVAAVMMPRTNMHCIQADSTFEEACKRLLEVGHSRIPVIGETTDDTDDIVGILYAKDLLKYMDAANGQTVKLSQIVREPFYVLETTGIDKLLETMKRKRVHPSHRPQLNRGRSPGAHRRPERTVRLQPAQRRRFRHHRRIRVQSTRTCPRSRRELQLATTADHRAGS